MYSKVGETGISRVSDSLARNFYFFLITVYQRVAGTNQQLPILCASFIVVLV